MEAPARPGFFSPVRPTESSVQNAELKGPAQILSTGSMREMHLVRSVEENWTGGYGLGFGSTRIRGRKWVGHAGGYPGYITRTYIQLEDKVGVIVLTNSSDGEATEIAQQLVATVGAAVAKAAAPKPETVEWDPS